MRVSVVRMRLNLDETENKGKQTTTIKTGDDDLFFKINRSVARE